MTTHSQSPVCNPSRASLMSGLYPETTGIYFLNPLLSEPEIGSQSEVLPKRFERTSYFVAAAGKLFHAPQENDRYYLACITFTDHQVGRVLDALEASGEANNTIIVLFSDHGFHLGEKDWWAKRSIWRDGAGTPLIIAGPGIEKGTVCDKPVQLLDIYPTLLDLTGLNPDLVHEGHALRPLLEDPEADWSHFARSSFGPRNVALISEHYRYIHYSDDSEKLYNLKSDPHEWFNIAADPAMEPVLEKHRADEQTGEVT